MTSGWFSKKRLYVFMSHPESFHDLNSQTWVFEILFIYVFHWISPLPCRAQGCLPLLTGPRLLTTTPHWLSGMCAAPRNWSEINGNNCPAKCFGIWYKCFQVFKFLNGPPGNSTAAGMIKRLLRAKRHFTFTLQVSSGHF